ncbi:hypothetical protein ACETU7_10530 [Rhodococcus sp. 3Y1]
MNEKGEPWVTPRDVPPMVFQQLPWLRPTARNKMFNADLVYRGMGGESFSFTMQPREVTVRSTLGTSTRLHHY